ncbi:protein spaetzle 4 [Planococcus citri]|uniref:protein spaetzle 4 n=1 Tax=Planococcus citri TaxID=170843 RepID=UPI0031F85132
MNADIFILLWLPFGLIHVVRSYDGYTTCSKPFRNSRSWSDLPCDFKNENWCVLPGSAYPWHAVRRFVFENHGLMKRMYGEQRHFSVLRAEIETNDVDYGSDNWHGYSEPAFKKYDKSTPTILRQTFTSASSSSPSSSSTTSSTTTSTSTVTTTTSSTTTKSTAALDNTTITDLPYSTEDEDVTSTENAFETTVSEELPLSPSTSTSASSLESSKTLQPQIFQGTTTELPTFRLKGVNACPVKEEVVAPFWANNTRGEMLALLNLYPFEQYVHWERCTFEHKQMYCRQGCRCEQQYRLHRLLAYDPTNDCRGIFSDWFKFPSCCVCKCYDIVGSIVASRSPRVSEEKVNFPPYFPGGWND